eukprot:4597342-Prymnesium_polylepis.1
MLWLLTTPLASTPTTCPPAASATVPCIQVDPFSSTAGSDFFKVTITTPGDVTFTTLRLALETDAVVDDGAAQAYAFIATDQLYPLQPGTGAFASGPGDWMGYSATLNQNPSSGNSGFILVLASGTPRTSPGE